MADRVKKAPPLRDWHLWADVKRSVTPLRPEPEEVLAEVPLPIPAPAAAGKAPPVFDKGAKWLGPALPPYLPPTSAKRKTTEPGREIEPRIRRRVVRGQIEIDGTIDLHGMRQDEAKAALFRFVTGSVARGDRTVLVITGKGLKRTDDIQLNERGILRAMLPIWLSEATLAPMIAGWGASARGDGGEGAFYVRLRRIGA